VYGDQLRVKREFLGFVPVWHYGVEIPGSRVAENGLFYGVRVNSFEGFANGATVEVVACDITMAERDAAVERALSREGEHAYRPFTGNCEHFATWCATGAAMSWQAVEWVARLAKVALAVAIAALCVNLRTA